MRGEILSESEMHEAGQHALTVQRIAIQHGLDGELAEVINFLNRIKWKAQKR
jgi:hypothetical protein